MPDDCPSQERFLTSAEKARELAFFENYKADPANWRREHPDNRGGSGYIDHEVLPLVDALNEIDGVCTVQSCCGHRWSIPEEGPGVECVHVGQLWIRLDANTSRLFDENVGDLLRSRAIRHVQKLYAYPESDAPHEVFDIQWQPGDMFAAHVAIAQFFRRLATLSTPAGREH